MLTVYLMRHGQSQANLERIFANGDDGYPLTEEGRAQVSLTAELLALKNIKRIYTSPILRARQSAAIVEKKLGIESVVLDEIREFSVGELEGQFISGEAESAFMRLMIQWISGNSSDKIPNGESHLEIMARMKKAIDIIVSENHTGEILLVSHGGFLTMTLPFICSGIDIREFFSRPSYGIGNCSITTVRVSNGAQSPSIELVEWANSSHLE